MPAAVNSSLYVNDLQISCQGKDMHFIEHLQIAINRIIFQAKNNVFNFSTDKTSCVHFCRSHGIHPEPKIFMNQRQISVVDTSCFLGVTFDKKLDFYSTHPGFKKEFDKTFNILKVLSNTTWGADCTSMIKIYRILIH